MLFPNKHEEVKLQEQDTFLKKHVIEGDDTTLLKGPTELALF
jgi:hypothetical protein